MFTPAEMYSTQERVFFASHLGYVYGVREKSTAYRVIAFGGVKFSTSFARVFLTSESTAAVANMSKRVILQT